MREYVMNQPVTPDAGEFAEMAKDIFESQWLTSPGKWHNALDGVIRNPLGRRLLGMAGVAECPLARVSWPPCDPRQPVHRCD